MDQSKALPALSALANEARLDLIKLLIGAGQAGLCAGAISKNLGISASRLSFHLSTLEQANLIQSRKSARNVIYSVNPAGLGGTIGFLLNDCCQENPEIVACCRQHSRQVPASLPISES